MGFRVERTGRLLIIGLFISNSFGDEVVAVSEVVVEDVVVDVVEGRFAGLPSFGLCTGAASESGCANFKSLICLISYLFSPPLKQPTSSLTVDREGRE